MEIKININKKSVVNSKKNNNLDYKNIFKEVENIFNFLLKAKYIIRWNEFARPIEFTVLDREALKLIFAIFLSQENKNINLKKVIQLSFASLIRKLILTDIKNSVYDKLKKYHSFEINRYIVNVIEKSSEIKLDNEVLNYIKNYDNINTKEKILLDIAGYIATEYEFNLLKQLNRKNYEFNNILNSFNKDKKKFKIYIEYQKYLKKRKKYKKIFDIINNLRYQKRGIRLPLINNFSILEHLYITTFITYHILKSNQYILNNDLNCKDKDKLIIVYSLISLFHDIPEALTRDIITPVKKSTNEIDKTIFKLEKKLIKKYFLKNISNKKFSRNIYKIIFFLNKYSSVKLPKGKLNLNKKIKFFKENNGVIINKDFVKFIDESFALLETVAFKIKEDKEILEIINRIKKKYFV